MNSPDELEQLESELAAFTPAPIGGELAEVIAGLSDPSARRARLLWPTAAAALVLLAALAAVWTPSTPRAPVVRRDVYNPPPTWRVYSLAARGGDLDALLDRHAATLLVDRGEVPTAGGLR